MINAALSFSHKKKKKKKEKTSFSWLFTPFALAIKKKKKTQPAMYFSFKTDQYGYLTYSWFGAEKKIQFFHLPFL